MPSLFQTLPHLVIAEIIDYLHGSTKPLLWICHDWRMAALGYLSHTYISDTSGKANTHKLDNWPERVAHPPAALFSPLVKEAKLILSFDQIVSGKFDMKQQLVFPSAVTLNVEFKYNSRANSTSRKEQLVETKLDEFLAYIGKMVPNVCNVRITTNTTTTSFDATGAVVARTARVFGGLVGMAKNRLAVSGSEGINGMGSKLPSLTEMQPAHITLSGVDLNGSVGFNESIRRCSQTLRSLVLNDVAGYGRIFQSLTGDDSDCEVYANLERLKITVKCNPNTPNSSGRSPEAAPFPRLKMLHLEGPYMLNDDILFRGSQNALQYLRMQMDSRVARILQNAQTFSGGNYRKLDYVKISSSGDGTSGDVLIPLISDMAHCASVLDIDCGYYGWRGSAKEMRLQFGQSLQSLKVLQLRHFELDMVEILDFVRAIPSLRTMGCRISDETQKVGCRFHHEWLEDLQSIYSSLSSSSLRCLEFTCRYQKNSIDTSRYILFLSILCPNLYIVKMRDAYERSKVVSRIPQLLRQKRFRQYADKSRTLKILTGSSDD